MESTIFQQFEFSLGEIARILFRHKRAILTILLATGVSAAFWIWFIRKDAYQTTAKLLVKIGHEQTSSSVPVSNSVMITGERLQDVNSEVEILKSADLIGQVVDHFGLDKPHPPDPAPASLLPRLKYYVNLGMQRFREWKQEVMIRIGLQERLSPREQIVFEIQRGLLVAAERNSTVITATLLSLDRKNAAALLNALLDFYQTFRLKVNNANGAAQFFGDETRQAAGNLAAAERELREFERAWDISALERQREVLLTEISGSEAQAREARIAFDEADSKVRRLEAEMKSAEPNLGALGAFPANSFPEVLLQQAAVLQKEREVLRMTELETGERIRNNRSQFRVLAGMLAAHLRSTAEEKKSVLRSREEALAQSRARLAQIQEREVQRDELKRKTRILEDNYFLYRRKLDESAALAGMENRRVSNVAIISHASDPVAPLGMRKTTLLGLALAIGAFACLAWVAVSEFLDDRVYDGELLETSLQAPLLAIVPQAGRRRWFPWRRHAGE